MASPQQVQILMQFKQGAIAHIWPAYAACEGVLETGWGTSELYLKGKNVFGEKQHLAPTYGTISLPTREFVNGGWETVSADFISFPEIADSFASRMATLRRLAPDYPNYAAALKATTGPLFINWVSKTWSTDPQRAQSVLEIYNAHEDILEG